MFHFLEYPFSRGSTMITSPDGKVSEFDKDGKVIKDEIGLAPSSGGDKPAGGI